MINAGTREWTQSCNRRSFLGLEASSWWSGFKLCTWWFTWIKNVLQCRYYACLNWLRRKLRLFRKFEHLAQGHFTGNRPRLHSEAHACSCHFTLVKTQFWVKSSIISYWREPRYLGLLGPPTRCLLGPQSEENAGQEEPCCIPGRRCCSVYVIC